MLPKASSADDMAPAARAMSPTAPPNGFVIHIGDSFVDAGLKQALRLFLAASTATGSIHVCRIVDDGCRLLGTVTSEGEAEVFGALEGSSLGPLRSGLAVEFGVNHAVHAQPEFVFLYARRREDNTLYVAAKRCAGGLDSGWSCGDKPGWRTRERDGQQFQPVLSFVDKSAAQDGPGASFQYAFYESDTSPVSDGTVRIVRARLGASMAEFELLGGISPNPEVCPARYDADTNGYWGDYFALADVPPARPGGKWRSLAIYSSDEDYGCEDPQRNKYQGRHLHLEASSWED